MPQNKTALQRRLLLALRDAGITVLILLLTTLLCMLLDEVGEASSYASLLYVLSVLVISRLTNGYLFGILASIAASTTYSPTPIWRSTLPSRAIRSLSSVF